MTVNAGRRRRCGLAETFGIPRSRKTREKTLVIKVE